MACPSTACLPPIFVVRRSWLPSVGCPGRIAGSQDNIRKALDIACVFYNWIHIYIYTVYIYTCIYINIQYIYTLYKYVCMCHTCYIYIVIWCYMYIHHGFRRKYCIYICMYYTGSEQALLIFDSWTFYFSESEPVEVIKAKGIRSMTETTRQL